MSYDAAGNQTNDGSGQRTYDAENRMLTATDGVIVGNYTYDADGRRVKRIISGVETWQIYGIGGELLAEYAAGTAPSAAQKEYGYRGGQLLVVWDGSETGDRQLQWLVQDHLGSTRMVVDRSGSLGGIRRHDFDPFGKELSAGVGIRSAALGYGDDGVRQKYTGHERDAETGLDFAQARYFASLQGRFTSVDPTLLSVNGTNPQTWNRYAYVLNNPLRYADPLGLWEIDTNPEYDKNGKLKRVVVYVRPSKEGDNAASLVKQLGYDPSSKEGQKLQAGIEKQMSQYQGAARVNLAEVGGNVGRIFQAVEYGLAAQSRYDQNPGRDPGPRDEQYNDCSMTTCRIAFPGRMIDFKGMAENANFGLQTADSIVSGLRSVPGDALRVGDIIRYANERNQPQHFMNAIFTGDDGTTYAFSRSGVNGRFEIVPKDRFVGSNYGSIRGIKPGDTGFYRP
jgi:RHS repeat-associated protein